MSRENVHSKPVAQGEAELVHVDVIQVGGFALRLDTRRELPSLIPPAGQNPIRSSVNWPFSTAVKSASTGLWFVVFASDGARLSPTKSPSSDTAVRRSCVSIFRSCDESFD
jgi:hypothetical protein